MSQMISPVAVSRTTVPRGTRMVKSAPSLPEHRFPCPGIPLSATYLRL